MKILLVDSPDVAEQEKSSLEDEKDELSVEIASSAEEALDLLDKNNYEAIVSDPQPLETDGTKFLKTVREEKKIQIPFIIFTNKNREEISIEALNSSVNRYIQKRNGFTGQYTVLVQAISREVENWRARKRLEKTEREKSLILNTVNEHIAFQDSDHHLVWVNESYANQLEKSPEEVKGQKCHEVWHDRKEPCEDCIVDEALELGEVRKREVSPSDREGHWFIKGVPVRGKEGDIRGAIEIVMDITEQKRAEDRLERFFKASPDPVYYVDVEGVYKDINEAACQLFGVERDEVVGKNFSEFEDIFPKGSREKIIENSQKQIQGEEVPPYIVKGTGKDGEIRYLEVNDSPVRENGRVKGFIGIARDVTERIKAQERAEREKERYEELFHGANELVITTDEEGYVKKVNEKTLEVSGYSEDELVGESVLNIAHPDKKEKMADFWKEVKKGKEVTRTLKVVDKEGNSLWVKAGGRPIIENGEIVEIQYNAQDITDRKKAEDRKEFLNAILRQDLRSKYRTMEGYLQIIEEGELSEEHKEYLEKALSSGRKANDILELARKLNKIERNETGSGKNIERILETVFEDISALPESEEVEIEKNYSENIGKVMGGKSLYTLFLHLLKIRVQTSKCKLIKISSEEKEEKMQITVEDDGKKLPEDVDKLFSEKIYTGKTAGIGGARYYIIKQIARHNNANIEIKESDLGGARFDINLKKA